ncbi:hypothetical protein OQA88_6985 [Cercophora sp. LCS_1]
MGDQASCGSNFTTITDFLNDAVAGSTNITEAVRQCPDVCDLVWGSGNPDLSGIGAYVSYIIQCVLTFLFGPVLVAAFACSSLEPGGITGSDAYKPLASLVTAHLDMSVGFSVPVAIAAIVRIRQSAPFYEIAFLEPLLTSQFLSLLATCLALGVLQIHKTPGAHRRILVVVVCILLEFSLYMVLVGYLRTSRDMWLAIQELGGACRLYGSVLPGFQYFQQPPSQPVTSFIERAGPRMAPIVIGLLIAAIAAIVLLFGVVFGLCYVIATGEPITLGLMSLGLAVGSAYCTVQMSRKRDAMRAILGDRFQDNEWGFGQVVALCLWAPLIPYFLGFLLSLLLQSPPPGKGVDQLDTTSPDGHGV